MTYNPDEEFGEVVGNKILLDNLENKMEKFTWKSELKSFFITFLVGFVLVIYEQLDVLTLEAFRDGAYIGVILGAMRAGIKSVIELFILLYSKK